jgi:hypothetical protein
VFSCANLMALVIRGVFGTDTPAKMRLPPEPLVRVACDAGSPFTIAFMVCPSLSLA